jgi:hypothetical protein
MLKNAHIWARDAALMRALGVMASVQHAPRMALQDKFRLAIEISADERWIWIITRCSGGRRMGEIGGI